MTKHRFGCGCGDPACPKCNFPTDDNETPETDDITDASKGDPEITFRATECNDDPITAPLSEVQEHQSWPVCSACNSITCREPVGEVPGLTDQPGEDGVGDREYDADDVRQASDEELVEALESLAINFCLEAGIGYAPVKLHALEIKRRLTDRPEDPDEEDDSDE